MRWPRYAVLAPPSLANASPACLAKLVTSERFTATARTPIATPAAASRPMTTTPRPSTSATASRSTPSTSA